MTATRARRARKRRKCRRTQSARLTFVGEVEDSLGEIAICSLVQVARPSERQRTCARPQGARREGAPDTSINYIDSGPLIGFHH